VAEEKMKCAGYWLLQSLRIISGENQLLPLETFKIKKRETKAINTNQDATLFFIDVKVSTDKEQPLIF